MEKINIELAAWLQKIGVAPEHAQWVLQASEILLIALVAYILYKICRRTVVPAIAKVAEKTEFKWDDYLLNDDVLNKACHLIPPVVLSALIPAILPEESNVLGLLMKVCDIYFIIAVLSLVCGIINSLYTISNEHEKFKNRSLKGFYQMLKLIVICIGVIIIVAKLINESPVGILTGLGAGAAILMLVFQDTIKGLVAGVQLTANDMIRPGDWISAPKYDADGDVIEVSLTTVKVRNWDKTITTVPPYALVNDSFQNWRGMFDTGGRRVKRSVNIDMHSVRFCTAEEMAYYRQQPWMEGYEDTGVEAVNLSVFRKYLDYYLRHNTKVHQEMLILVRQLQPTADGLPLELYFFSADTAWVRYEALQAEVFEHLLAVVHKFDLKVFQSPTGLDLQTLAKK
jgi:miniconductance mechanosensitive channel